MAEAAQIAEIAEKTVTPEQFAQQMPDGRKLLSDEPENESGMV